MFNNKEEYFKILKDNSYGVFPAPTDAQLGIDLLGDYLLGEDWYTITIGNEQVNTEMVYAILDKYSPEFRRDIRKEQNKSTFFDKIYYCSKAIIKNIKEIFYD